MFFRSLLCATLAAALAPFAFPQQPKFPAIRSVTFNKIKAGEMANHNAAVKEMIGIVKQAGVPVYWSTWISQTGDRETAVVRYHEKYAELDQNPFNDPKLKDKAGQLTAIWSRLYRTVESSRRVIDAPIQDLSLPMTAEPPNLVAVSRVIVKPDRVDDYLKLYKSDLLPAVKKTGAKVFGVARTQFGAPAHSFTVVTELNGFSQLDSPSTLVAAMGEAAYQTFVSKITPMVDRREVDIYRFAKNISYLPEPITTSGR